MVSRVPNIVLFDLIFGRFRNMGVDSTKSVSNSLALGIEKKKTEEKIERDGSGVGVTSQKEQISS